MKDKIRIAVANLRIYEKDFCNRLKKRPKVKKDRFERIKKILDEAERQKADIIVFPEFAIPPEFIEFLTKYVMHKQRAIVFGMDYIINNDYAFNYCGVIIPVENEQYKDAVFIPRLKNHYAPKEIEIIEGYGLKVPKVEGNNFRYDIFNYQGCCFSVFYCFELADISHRALLRSKVDLVIVPEFNKDTTYFSNIVESSARDLHCYFVQCNTSQYGDTRVTAPKKTIEQDLAKIKGGDSDVLLIAELDIKKLREFQEKEYPLQFQDKSFKPTPPNFERENVKQRILESQAINDE